MPELMTLTRMTPGDAISVTKGVQAAVAECVAEHGPETVGPLVTASSDAMVDAMGPLVDQLPASGTERRAVDRATDRCIGSIYRIATSFVRLFDQTVLPLTPEEEDLAARARRIVDELFPNGIGFVQTRWSEQFGVTEAVVQRARRPQNRDDLAALGLDKPFSLLERLHATYGERMGFTGGTTNETGSALDRWYGTLERYLGAVVATHPAGTPLRDQLLAPYRDVATDLRAARRRAASETDAPTSSPLPED